jgi:DNA-binding XRE family transcriptional regulator
MSSPPAEYQVRLAPLPAGEADEAARRGRERLVAALKRERALRGWTQDQAAAIMGLDRRRYRRIEQGSAPVTLRTLEQLAAAFAVELPALLR